jgi:hypothetical protein
VLLDTVLVLTLKVALVLPAGTETLDGTVATDVFLLESVTSAPPDGALELSVTVPVELLPPLTLVGFRVSEEMAAADPGVMVIEAWTVLLPRDAVITTAVLLRTPGLVLTVNVALVAPAATVTLDGTIAKELSLLNPTTAPPDGAAPLKVTVP